MGQKEETKNLNYLSKVFKELPKERKDGLLNTARLLLKIQDNATVPLLSEKPVSPLLKKKRR